MTRQLCDQRKQNKQTLVPLVEDSDHFRTLAMGSWALNDPHFAQWHRRHPKAMKIDGVLLETLRFLLQIRSRHFI